MTITVPCPNKPDHLSIRQSASLRLKGATLCISGRNQAQQNCD